MLNFSITAAPDSVNNYPIYLVIHTLWEADKAVGHKRKKTKQNKYQNTSLNKDPAISQLLSFSVSLENSRLDRDGFRLTQRPFSSVVLLLFLFTEKSSPT